MALSSLRQSSTRRLIVLAFSALIAGLPVISQTPPRKPALIRDTDKAEGKDEAEAAKPKEYNPLQAQASLKIGDFYFKRKNYQAAIERYIEALEYQPNLIAACEALGQAYVKAGRVEKAVETYKDFIRKYPDSPKVSAFQSKIAKLEKKK